VQGYRLTYIPSCMQGCEVSDYITRNDSAELISYKGGGGLIVNPTMDFVLQTYMIIYIRYMLHNISHLYDCSFMKTVRKPFKNLPTMFEIQINDFRE